MQLLADQINTVSSIYAAWQGQQKNVLAVSPTGSGKTVMMGSIMHAAQYPALAIAHRRELVSQIALTIARYRLRHRIIAPKDTISFCRSLQKEELGYHMVDPDARIGVAGVDTLLRRTREQAPFLEAVKLWQMDEAHHIQRENKWGKAVELFPDAWGLGWTATPYRADGGGLGAGEGNDGVFNDMVLGPTPRELIDAGRLSDYRVVVPPSDLASAMLKIGSTGDYTQASLSAQVAASNRIVGDVVQTYLKFARGKRGVTFTPDVESAGRIARAYREAGVPAEVVSAKTPDALRTKFIRQLKTGELLQLVNVDLFGEGFDLPAIEVVSMVRRTMSLALYIQQFGRALRLFEGKDRGLIIDHVGNFGIHGAPDRPRLWSLERSKDRRAPLDPDAIPSTTCENPECFNPYPAYLKACPYCGSVKAVLDRSSPEAVAGDLVELAPEILAALRGEVANVDKSTMDIIGNSKSMSLGAQHGRINNHIERQNAQAELRDAMAWFGGVQRHAGLTISEAQKLFYYRYKIDTLSAMALGAREARDLKNRILEGFKT